jgi:hypothetical protein
MNNFKRLTLGVAAVSVFCFSVTQSFAAASADSVTGWYEQFGDTDRPIQNIKPVVTEPSNILGLGMHTTRGAYDSQRNSEHPACVLITEDFEDGNVGNGTAKGCFEPMDENTNDLCFLTGQIPPGVTYRTFPGRGGNGIVLAGPNFQGSNGKSIGANFFVDHWVMEFESPGADAASWAHVCEFSSDPNAVVTVRDDGGAVIGTQPINCPDNTQNPNGQFFGAVGTAGTKIGSFRIASASNQAEMILTSDFCELAPPPPPPPPPGECDLTEVLAALDALETKADALEVKADVADGKLDSIEAKLDTFECNVEICDIFDIFRDIIFKDKDVPTTHPCYTPPEFGSFGSGRTR